MPEKQQTTATTSASETSSAPSTATEQNADKKHILVVEDEKPLSHALKLKLSHEGYNVSIAENGEEGMKFAMDEQFDLILIDIIMPKMDGFTMLEKLQESPHKFMIIVLSNLGQKEDIEKAKKLGATDYLVKSNTPISSIVAAVNTLLKGK